MPSPNRPARANRTLLITLGTVVTAAGAFSLLTTYGLLPTPGFGPNRVLITSHAPPASWVTYVVTVVAILLGLACLWFLTAQARHRPRTRTWRLPGDQDRGTTRLHADTAAEPLTDELETYPGVLAAAAWLSGSPAAPALLLRLRTDHEADLTALRANVHTDAIPRLRAALALDGLPTEILIEPTTSHIRTR
jgi:formate hydrogenlyase subunit 3/multisubunit Na+/H+ antiporter MnhD subunit